MNETQTQERDLTPMEGVSPPVLRTLEPFKARTEEEWLTDPELVQLGRTLSPVRNVVDRNAGAKEYLNETLDYSNVPLVQKMLEFPETQEAMQAANEGYEYTDLDYAQGALDTVGQMKWNLPDLGLTALGFSEWSDEQQIALIRSLEIYDSMPTQLRHIGRALGGVATDPSSYIGIGAIANIISKIGVKSGAKVALSHLLNNTAKGAAIVGTVEGGLYTGLDNAANQHIQNQADTSKFDFAENAKATGIGMGAGGFLGGFLGKIFGGKVPEGITDEAEDIPLEDVVQRLEAEGEVPPTDRAADDIIDEDAPIQGELLDDGTGTGVVHRQQPSESTEEFVDGALHSEGNARLLDDNPVGDDWSHMYNGEQTFNIDRIETLDDAKDFVEAASSQWEKTRLNQADPNPDGVETLVAVKQKAYEAADELLEETGMDISGILNKFKDDHSELQQIRARAQAMRMLNVKLAEKVFTLAEKQHNTGLSKDEAQEFLEHAGLFSQVMELTKLTSREFSRGLGNYRLIVKGDGKLLQGLANKEAMGDVEALSKTILSMTNAGKIKRGKAGVDLSSLSSKERGAVIKQMRKELKESRYKKVMSEIIRFRSAMMLSGPSTIEAAAFSNFSKLWGEPFWEWAGHIGVGTEKKQARTRALAQYAGTRRFFFDSWKQAATAWKTGQHITDPFITKIEGQLDGNLQNRSWLRRNVWERGVNAAHLALLFLDEGIKANRSRALVYADTVVEAQKAGLAVKSPEFETLLQQNILAKFDGNGKLRDNEILREVREATYTSELEGLVGEMFTKVANAGGGMGRLIAVPFIRAPINIVSESLMYMPIPPSWTARQDNIMKYGSPIAKQKLKARKALGAAAIGGIYWAAEEDLITGSGPSDYKLREAWKQAGHQPYSIRVGDEWVSYAKLGPMSILMGTVADINAMMRMDTSGTNIEDAALGYMGAVQHSLVQNLLNKAYFSSINQLMDGLQDPDALVSYGQNIVASFTPNLLSQMNADENVREANTILEKIQRRIPIISEKLGKQYDFYGREILKPRHDIPVYGYMFKNNAVVSDKVADEVYALSNTMDRAILQKMPYTIGLSQTDFRDVYDFGESESVYAKLNRFVGEVRDPNTGDSLHKALSKLVKSDDYRHAPHSDFADITPPKARMIQAVVNAYRSMAKEKLHNESRAYRTSLREKGERLEQVFK